jgi:hypothetical protein
MLLEAGPRKSLRWKAPAELFLPQGTFDLTNMSQIQLTTLLLAIGPTLTFLDSVLEREQAYEKDWSVPVVMCLYRAYAGERPHPGGR